MKKYLLCDTTREVEYSEYLDFCECNELEPMGEESADFYDFCAEEREREWDDFIANIEYSSANDYYWIITGSLGLWDGRHDIYPTIEPSLEKAVNACFGRSIMDISIEKRGSVLYVCAYHHDGRNYFELRALTDLGVERFERNGEISLNNRQNIRKLPEFLF